MSDLSTFDEHFRQWAYAACTEWGYPPPAIEWFEAAHARLPVGLRTQLGRGIDAGLVQTVGGHHFSVAGGGGPYSWFGRDDRRAQATPNWAYAVQVAEYLRIRLLVGGGDLHVGFADEAMGISVRRDGDLLWQVEARETFGEVYELSRHLDRFGAGGIDHGVDDSGDDALRLAKVVVDRRPLYFSLVGIGGRLDFSVAVHDAHHFDLIPDLVPVGARP